MTDPDLQRRRMIGTVLAAAALASVAAAALTAGLPRQPKALTLLRLQAGRIMQVSHAADEAGLRDALGARP